MTNREIRTKVMNGTITLEQAKHEQKKAEIWKQAVKTGNLTEWYHFNGILSPEIDAYNQYIRELMEQGIDTSVPMETIDFSNSGTDGTTGKNYSISILSEEYTEEWLCKDLRKECHFYGLVTTGKKSELIDRLKDYQHDCKRLVLSASENDTPDKQAEIALLLKYDVRFAHSIVRRVASGTSQQSDACMKIVNSGYTDTLFDDIKQEIGLTLVTLFKTGKAWFSDGGITFNNYETETGEQRTYYLMLWSAMRKAISDSKQMNYQAVRNDNFDTDFDNPMDLLKMIEDREDAISFIKYLKNRDKKNYSDYMAIVHGLFDGVKYAQIAEEIGTNERRIKYLAKKLYEYAVVFFASSTSIHKVQYLRYADKSGSILLSGNNIMVDKYTRKTVGIKAVPVTRDGEPVYNKSGSQIFEYYTGTGQKLHSTPEKGLRVYTGKYAVRGTGKGLSVPKHGNRIYTSQRTGNYNFSTGTMEKDIYNTFPQQAYTDAEVTDIRRSDAIIAFCPVSYKGLETPLYKHYAEYMAK